ncbi:MAG: hypothetical protein ACI837_000646 [Crocinitomicaceae bacterium]|jgi:hypothetical protein
MNKILIIVVSLLTFQGISQDFSIPVKDHPHYNLIEWRGNGGLLMSRSHKEFMQQINLTLIADKEEGMWDQKFNPKTREPFYLSSENARHVYFLDFLDLQNNGKQSFNQINFGGGVKLDIADIGIKLKRLGVEYDYNKFELLNCAVTDKALVSHYRYYDKKEKETYEYATFITHHNFAVYPIQLGYVHRDKISDGKAGQWQYAGFKDELAYFAWREVKTDIDGWIVRGFSAKGELEEDIFLNAPKNLIQVVDIGFGPVGKYYLPEDRRTLETGLVSVINDKFYVLVAMERNGGTELVLSELADDDETWIEINSKKFDYNPEFPINLGIYPITEGITYHFEHNGLDVASILHFDKEREGLEKEFDEYSIYNLSSLLYEKKDTEFMTGLDSMKLTCDMTQFLKVGGIRFEHREK